MAEDLLRDRQAQNLGLHHLLVVLSNGIIWQVIEACHAQRWARQVNSGKKIEAHRLFGSTWYVVGNHMSNIGHSRLSSHVGKDNTEVKIEHRGKDNRITNEERRLLERRKAIEPVFGHLKTIHLMGPCYLEESQVDEGQAVLWTAVPSINWPFWMIVRKGLGRFLCLCQITGLQRLAGILGLNRLQSSGRRWGCMK